MRFKEAYEGWHAGELTQIEAARLLGMCDRSFRRYLARYEEFDMQGLIDKRIEQVSHRRAPVDEVMKLVALYGTQYEGWNVKHFHSWYRREHQGSRSSGTCGMTKVSGVTKCGAILSSTSRSASASATSRNWYCSR